MQTGHFRQRLTPILITLCLTLLTAASSRADGKRELVQLFSPFPHHFNSAITDNLSVAAVGANVFTFLTTVGASGEIEPCLAEAWRYSEDGLTLTFQLRTDTVFHDGAPVRAHDVLFSYATFRKYHPLGEQMFRRVVDAESPDDHSFILHLSKPDPSLLHSVSAPFMPILPEHVYSRGDIRRNPANQHPVGSGPFRVTRFQAGDTFTMERFDNYLKPGLPRLNRITGMNGEDPLFAVSILKSGVAQLFNFVEDPDIINLVSDSDHLWISPEGYSAIGGMNYLAFNLHKTPLRLLKVRQAIMHAIDPAALGIVLYGNRSRVLDGPFPPGSRFYQQGITPSKPDLKLAEQLLDEAGLTRGEDRNRFETRLTWLPDDSGAAERAAAIIKVQLSKIGIRLILDKPQDNISPWLKLAKWQYHMILARIHVWDDPVYRLHSLFSSRQMVHRAGANTFGFRNEQADVLLDAAAVEMNPEIRRQLYGQFQDLIREEMPIAFLHMAPYVSILNRDLEIPVSGRGVMNPMDRVAWKTETPEPQNETDEKESGGSGLIGNPVISN